MKNFIIFTDLDGTLLEPDTYSFEPAREQLQRLQAKRIPVVFTTSKTRAEVEQLRHQTGNTDPFIVENGGAVYLPREFLPEYTAHLPQSGPYRLIQLGTPYEQLVRVLKESAAKTGCPIRGFHMMNVAEIANLTGLSFEQAQLAAQREYDEPFQILTPECSESLLREIEKRGLNWTRGGRFYHILGNNNKAQAARQLLDLLKKAGHDVLVIALGDSFNDLELLQIADVPIIVSSAHAPKLKELLPHARVTSQPGPRGWAEAISEVIPD